jgi:hypothetical protein
MASKALHNYLGEPVQTDTEVKKPSGINPGRLFFWERFQPG